MSHLTYAEAWFAGLLQGITELVSVSSPGHAVLIPALALGQWAQDRNVSKHNVHQTRLPRDHGLY